MSMRQHVERYVTQKQRLGLKYENEGKILRDYAQNADERGDDFVCSDAMIEWSAEATTVYAARRRLTTLRNFALWLRSEDRLHEVPPRGILGWGKKKRPAPHLLTWKQIRLIMDAALDLQPAGSIKPHAVRFIIGLIAATGLRRSEAAYLRFSDITADGLVIRETKFRKSRLVVLHPTVRAALDRYLAIRTQTVASQDRLFVLPTGRPMSSQYLSDIFRTLVIKVGLKNSHGRTGPTLHGLRHSFAVRSLEAAKATAPEKVSRHMAALSTYLGHVNVGCTYWYLEATPALLQSIADATETAHNRRAAE